MASGLAASDPSLNGISSTPGENEYPSGFPQSICDEVPKEKYLCSNCNNVLNKARQTVCGHRYCLACVNWLVRNNKDLVCTKCKEEDPSVESDTSELLTLDQFFNDAAINKEILDLKVHCANQGCPWRSTLKNFEDHQSQCEYALIPCNIGCGIMVQRKTLATHLERGCPNNKTTCSSCAGVLTPRELQKHVCPSSSDKKATKADKRQKNNHSGSSKKKEPCIFSEVGCSFKGFADKVKEHESCSHVGHLQLLLDVTRALQRTLSSPAERGQREILDFLQPEHCASLASLSEGEIETDGGDPGVSDKAFSLHDDQVELAVGQQLDAIQQRVQVMENIISVLNREVEKTQLSVVALERDNANNQQIIEHLENKVAELLQRLVRKDIHISSLQQCISAQQDVSYDGTFLWRLCDVSQSQREAASGVKISQYSPAFYTARYGFKVCMRLYLNGDGVGKGTHISLFFVIMKGEYDPILSWPFRHKVNRYNQAVNQ
ncbi:TNF receptor-associated factor [Pimephales promelas]|nr:TNF receptor-associated factor [Pimephales promelas]KAG1972047.1 TNF receptor-associated factor [Pimephales promelas]